MTLRSVTNKYLFVLYLVKYECLKMTPSVENEL